MGLGGNKMIMKAENVSRKYKVGENNFFALKGVSFEVKEKEIITILGPSGSGKSTLLNIIGGIDRIDEGEIEVDGIKLSQIGDRELTMYRREKIGFVFQFYNLIPNLTVYENVEVSSSISKNAMDIKEVLESVGMLDKSDKFPSELSGGEQQRVSIARAIVKNPKILLFDEPTGALDYSTSKDILNLIEKINIKYGTTMFIVTHNNAISAMSDRIIKLRSGEITEIITNRSKIKAEGVEW